MVNVRQIKPTQTKKKKKHTHTYTMNRITNRDFESTVLAMIGRSASASVGGRDLIGGAPSPRTKKREEKIGSFVVGLPNFRNIIEKPLEYILFRISPYPVGEQH